MEDRNRKCNIHISGLEEGLKGCDAIQFLAHSISKWFRMLWDLKIEIMRAHQIYNDNACKEGANRTLIVNLLHPACLAILHATRKDLSSIKGRRIRFSHDYSNFTVKRCLAFHQAMVTAWAKGLDLFLLYPATLKINDSCHHKTFTYPKEAEDFLASVVAPNLETYMVNNDGFLALIMSKDGWYTSFITVTFCNDMDCAIPVLQWCFSILKLRTLLWLL